MAPPFSHSHSQTSTLYSDASGSFGCGAVVEGIGWFQIQWPETWGGVDIATKELIPVVVAAALWGSMWEGKHIYFYTDNMSVVAILSSQAARTPGLTHLMRCFLFYAAYYRFHFSA